jgi:hypothetical protein
VVGSKEAVEAALFNVLGETQLGVVRRTTMRLSKNTYLHQ